MRYLKTFHLWKAKGIRGISTWYYYLGKVHIISVAAAPPDHSAPLVPLLWRSDLQDLVLRPVQESVGQCRVWSAPVLGNVQEEDGGVGGVGKEEREGHAQQQKADLVPATGMRYQTCSSRFHNPNTFQHTFPIPLFSEGRRQSPGILERRHCRHPSRQSLPRDCCRLPPPRERSRQPPFLHQKISP